MKASFACAYVLYRSSLNRETHYLVLFSKLLPLVLFWALILGQLFVTSLDDI